MVNQDPLLAWELATPNHPTEPLVFRNPPAILCHPEQCPTCATQPDKSAWQSRRSPVWRRTIETDHPQDKTRCVHQTPSCLPTRTSPGEQHRATSLAPSPWIRIRKEYFVQARARERAERLTPCRASARTGCPTHPMSRKTSNMTHRGVGRLRRRVRLTCMSACVQGVFATQRRPSWISLLLCPLCSGPPRWCHFIDTSRRHRHPWLESSSKFDLARPSRSEVPNESHVEKGDVTGRHPLEPSGSCPRQFLVTHTPA